MFNVRLGGYHLYGKGLFTWLSLFMSLMVSFCPVIFISDRPMAALLFWFFGDFRCGVRYLSLFLLYINIKLCENRC